MIARNPRRTRRNPAAHLEWLEDRRLLTVNFTQVADVLTVSVSGPINNTVVINDSGLGGAAGNITATGDGANFSAGSHVREIIVNTDAGNDKITYNLNNTLFSP